MALNILTASARNARQPAEMPWIDAFAWDAAKGVLDFAERGRTSGGQNAAGENSADATKKKALLESEYLTKFAEWNPWPADQQRVSGEICDALARQYGYSSGRAVARMIHPRFLWKRTENASIRS
jgi:hypothetical protein